MHVDTRTHHHPRKKTKPQKPNTMLQPHKKIPKTIWNMLFVFGQHVLECCSSGLCEKDIASVLPRTLCHAMPWLRFAVNFHPSKMRLPCGPKNRAHIVHEIPANKNEGRQSAFTFCGLLSATEIGRETCAAFCCAALEKNKLCPSKKNMSIRACMRGNGIPDHVPTHCECSVRSVIGFHLRVCCASPNTATARRQAHPRAGTVSPYLQESNRVMQRSQRTYGSLSTLACP